MAATAKRKRRNLGPYVADEAASLRAAYEHAKEKDGLTQDALAGALKFKTQAAVWQYLSGKIELNAPAAAKFAKALHVSVRSFSPRLAEEIQQLARDARVAVDDPNGAQFVEHFPVSPRGRTMAGDWEQIEDEALKASIETFIHLAVAAQKRGELPRTAPSVTYSLPAEKTTGRGVHEHDRPKAE